MKRNGRSGVNNVLITGISGFLGLNLTERLLSKAGYNVYGIADNLNPLARQKLKEWTASGKLKFYKLDLLNLALLRRVISRLGLNYVAHLAGYVDSGTSYEIAKRCVDSNIKGTLNLLEAVKGLNIRRFVYSSTIEIYGNNFDLPSTYAVTKLTGEMLSRLYFRLYGIPVAILRFANVYGPYQKKDKIIPMSILNSLESKDVYLKSRRGQGRDFCFVSDAAEAIIASFNNKKAIGQTFDIVSGRDYSIHKTAKMIVRKTNSKSRIILKPTKARPLETRQKKYWAGGQDLIWKKALIKPLPGTKA